MKKVLFIALVLNLYCIAALCDEGYENGMINLKVPTDLVAGQGAFDVVHRFNHTDDNPFNINSANVGIGLKYLVLSKLELNFMYSYIVTEKEIAAGASYALIFPQIWLRTQFDAQFISFEPADLTARQNSFFMLLSFQSEPLFNRVSPVINVGYDGYNQRPGLGTGLSFTIIKSEETIKGLYILGEYFPKLGDSIGKATYLGKENSFTFGIKVLTAAHQFMLVCGNTADLGTRRNMLGAQDNKFFVGFNIERLFDFN